MLVFILLLGLAFSQPSFGLIAKSKDLNFRQVSVGHGGAWAIARNKSVTDGPESVFYLTASNKGKLDLDPEILKNNDWDEWTKNGLPNIDQLAVGNNIIWALKGKTVYYAQVKQHVNPLEDLDLKWTKAPKPSELLSISVSPKCNVWAVNKKFKILKRKGADSCDGDIKDRVGTDWKLMVVKSDNENVNIRSVSAGKAGVWAVSKIKNEVFYKDNTRYTDTYDAEGGDWIKVEDEKDIKIDRISSGGKNNLVLAVDSDGLVWRRVGIDNKNPIGTEWKHENGGPYTTVQALTDNDNVFISVNGDGHVAMKYIGDDAE